MALTTAGTLLTISLGFFVFTAAIEQKYVDLYIQTIKKYADEDGVEYKKPEPGTFKRFVELVKLTDKINADDSIPFRSKINRLFLEPEWKFINHLGFNLTEHVQLESEYKV